MPEKLSKNYIGITRNRLVDYLKIKGRKTVAKKRFSKASLTKIIDQDDAVKSNLLNYSTKASEIQLTQLNEPQWMAEYRKCCHNLNEVDQIMDDIREQKAKKMSAIHQEKHSKIIDQLYASATNKIQQNEKIIRGIQKMADFNSEPQQKKIFANSLISLAMRMRQKTKNIRTAQQQDLSQKKQLRKFQINKFDGTNLMNKDIDQNGQWISQQDFQILQEQLTNQRNQQILKIVSSIHSLNTIYKELQDLVIQQGSLLDRIDMNIDQTAQHVQKANQHLTKAEEYQKSPLANRVIFVLVTLIVIFVLILALR